jgi:hypothetical protein
MKVLLGRGSIMSTDNSSNSNDLSTTSSGTIEYYCVQYHTYLQKIAPNCHDIFHGNIPQSGLAPKVGCMLTKVVPAIIPELRIPLAAAGVFGVVFC